MRVRIPPPERSLRAVVSPQLVAPAFSQLTANAGRTTSTVNRLVAGSSPAGPTSFRALTLRCLSAGTISGKAFQMIEPDPANPSREAANASREERLAAKLRENLRRRKAQARELRTPVSAPEQPGLPKSGADS